MKCNHQELSKTFSFSCAFLTRLETLSFSNLPCVSKECEVGACSISLFSFVIPENVRKVQCRKQRFKWSCYKVWLRLSFEHHSSSEMCYGSAASVTKGNMDVGSRQPGLKFQFDLLGCVTLVE